MKRILSIVLCVALFASCAACSQPVSDNTQHGFGSETAAPPQPSPLPAEPTPTYTWFETDPVVDGVISKFAQITEYTLNAEDISKGNIRSKAIMNVAGMYIVIINSNDEFVSISISDEVNDADIHKSLFADFVQSIDASISADKIETAWNDIQCALYEFDYYNDGKENVYRLHNIQLQYVSSLNGNGKSTIVFLLDPDAEAKIGEVHVDENLLDVDVTLPPDFFDDEDMTAFDPDAYAAEMGFKKAILHDDGSVTVTMTKAFHKEFMKELALSLEEAFAEVGPINNVSCIQEVKHNGNFTEITVVVDRALYEENGAGLSTLAILVLASYYIAFDGNTGADITVNTVDGESGEVLNSYNTSQLAE